MITTLALRAKAAEKRAAAQKILDAVASGAIVREMSPEEKIQFDGLMADVQTIKGQISSLKAIEDDEADDEAIEEVPAERSVRRGKPIGEAPAVHAKKHSYSINRALRLKANNEPLDGLENEVNQLIARQRGQQPKGFYIPTGANPEVLRAMFPGRDAEEHVRSIRRDLTTSTGVGSIFLEAELPLVELLRAKLVVRDLGATFLTDLKGTFAFMRQTSGSQFYWLGEGTSTTNSNPTYDQIPFVPKTGIAQVVISKEFLFQTSLDAEADVRKDLAEQGAREIDRVALNGSGSTQPLGLLRNSTIIANSAGIALGANGNPFTYGTAVAMESQVATYNADLGKLAYLFSPGLRGELKQTPLIAPTSGQAGYPFFVFTKGDRPGEGEVNSYRALTTSLMPTNLTKGTGTNLKAAIFGNWSDLYVGQWEGIDTLVNPYTLQSSGGVIISMTMGIDVEVKHPESFSIVNDAT